MTNDNPETRATFDKTLIIPTYLLHIIQQTIQRVEKRELYIKVDIILLKFYVTLLILRA